MGYGKVLAIGIVGLIIIGIILGITLIPPPSPGIDLSGIDFTLLFLIYYLGQDPQNFILLIFLLFILGYFGTGEE